MKQMAGKDTIQDKPTKERFVLVGILLLTLLVAYLDRVNVSVLVADPVFLQEMGILGKPVQMGLLMTVFLIAYGFSNVLLSPLGDWMGPRKAMCLSILLWAVSLLFGGFASTFTMVLIARAVLGVGEGMHWPMQSKYVKNWFPPQERGKANSVWLIGLMIGPAVSMPIFTWVVHELGWRPSFFLLVVIGLVPLTLLWFHTKDHPHQSPRCNEAERRYIEDALELERQAEAASSGATVMENIKLIITDYRFWLLTVFYFSVASVWWGTMAWLPSYLKVARGFNWAAMGALSSLPYVLGAGSIMLFGYLIDRTGRRAPFAMLSMLGAAAGIYFGAHAEDNFTAALLISFGIASVAMGLPAAWAMLQQIVPGKAVGAGAGMMNGLSNGGSAFSPVLIGFFISLSGSYVGGLMFLVGMALLGAFCMLVLTLKKY